LLVAEKCDICNNMSSSRKAVLDTKRADFEIYPPEIQTKLLDALCASGVEPPGGGGACMSKRVARPIGS